MVRLMETSMLAWPTHTSCGPMREVRVVASLTCRWGRGSAGPLGVDGGGGKGHRERHR
jgi:hypothetical protein